jgi:hypothetical protein
MNKKYVIYSMLMMLLIANKSSFSMQHLVFRGTQVASAGLCIGIGLKNAHDSNKQLKEPVLGVHVQGPVKKWAEKEMAHLGVPKIPLMYALRHNWSILSDRKLCIPENEAQSLERALDCEQRFLRERNTLEQSKKWHKQYGTLLLANRFMLLDYHIDRMNNAIKMSRDEIASYKSTLRHEFGHFINQDMHRKMHAMAWIPIVVQSGCSGITYAFNKLGAIKPPSSMNSALLRSSLAVGSIPMKIFLTELGMKMHSQYLEVGADKFALENAQSRQELVARSDYFSRRANFFEENGLKQKRNYLQIIYSRLKGTHPPDRCRANMAQAYIDKWDAEHPDEAVEQK